MEKELGGQRIGSESKMDIQMKNYERSTHDLSYRWRSSMACGAVVPFMSKLALNGDSWKIDLKTLIRTLPTVGPIFGQYKLQLDVYQCPIRLYQSLLHNNATAIGLKMNQVVLPVINGQGLTHQGMFKRHGNKIDFANCSSNSLLNYLGYRNFDCGAPFVGQSGNLGTWERQAVPVLAYYDIIKNYYANKQEEVFYTFGPKYTTRTILGVGTGYAIWNEDKQRYQTKDFVVDSKVYKYTGEFENIHVVNKHIMIDLLHENSTGLMGGALLLYGNPNTLSTDGLKITSCVVNVNCWLQEGADYIDVFEVDEETKKDFLAKLGLKEEEEGMIVRGVVFNQANIPTNIKRVEVNVIGAKDKERAQWVAETALNEIPIENVDKMRREILKSADYNQKFVINGNISPYMELGMLFEDKRQSWQDLEAFVPYNSFPMAGLAVKCYLADQFENWVNTEWIDGENGIAALTAVDIQDESFTIDSLMLKKKLYDVMMRVAVSGNSYEDWQEAIWGEEALRRAESPIYLGGLQAEIGFDEVVATANSEYANGNNAPLGALGGRGSQNASRGATIELNVKEPSYIIGLVSITPRVDYSQGNYFDVDELKTMDDLHKPGLDEIGFQNLMARQLCGWAGENEVIGKQPAWINYMTAVDETHGDFAEEDKAGFMVLNRKYRNKYNQDTKRFEITNASTYIEPSEYNNGFADTSLTAQNFWVQIGVNAIARRKMSAKVMPNL